MFASVTTSGGLVSGSAAADMLPFATAGAAGAGVVVDVVATALGVAADATMDTGAAATARDCGDAPEHVTNRIGERSST